MNKYQLWYNNLIENALCRAWDKKTAPEYVERHHIIPKSLGGSNDSTNLVFLTAREHCIAHLLLCKFGDSNQKSKMLYAMARFMYCNKDKINSKLYGSIKVKISENKSSAMKNNKHLLNHKHSDETKTKMSIKRIGVAKTDNMKKLVSEKMKVTLNSKSKVTCPHCNVSSINQSNMTRWHFDNCRNNNVS